MRINQSVKSQHVYSARAISEFANSDGFVNVFIKPKGKIIPSMIHPRNGMFCVQGVWAQWSENHPAEGEFHKELPLIKSGLDYNDAIISWYYLLWKARSACWGVKGYHWERDEYPVESYFDQTWGIDGCERTEVGDLIRDYILSKMEDGDFKNIKWSKIYAAGDLEFLNSESPLPLSENKGCFLFPVSSRVTLYGHSQRIKALGLMGRPVDDVFVKEQNKLVLKNSKRHVFASDLYKTGCF